MAATLSSSLRRSTTTSMSARRIRRGASIMAYGCARLTRFATPSCSPFIVNINNAPMLRIEIAVPAGEAASTFTQRTFAELEQAVQAARSYRGKVLSLDGDADYRGRSRGIMVHRLPPVDRDEVILPERTLELLDRNVIDFVGSRGAAARTRPVDTQGPPALRPAGHRQDAHDPLPRRQPARPHDADHHGRAGRAAGRLHEACAPAAADHGGDRGRRPDRPATATTWRPCEESLLNELLNEMDGLEGGRRHPVRADHQPARAAGGRAGRPPGPRRPGDRVPAARRRRPERSWSASTAGACRSTRVADEAVRAHGRCQRGLHQGADAAPAQGSVAVTAAAISTVDLDEALDDMLFAGGRLNVRLLGGAQEMVAG